MKLVTLLHFYQPYNQQDDILDRIVNECYRPLLSGLLENKDSKIVINIPGSTTMLLREKGYEDVLNSIKKLVDSRQAEFTSSAMYHAFLPLLPKDEIKRQIQLNNKTNSMVFGGGYNPQGFFSPEMAVNNKVLNIVEDFNYKWVSVPQIALFPKKPSSNVLYKLKKKNLSLFFRNKRVSSLILSAVTRQASGLLEESQDLHTKDKYWFTVMDAETFGHHRIGHEKLLFDIMRHDFFEPVLVSELIKSDLPKKEVNIIASTWTNEEQDFWLDKQDNVIEANSFILWKDPDNPIHNLQWKLTDFVTKKVEEYKDYEGFDDARKKLDKALASDQYWWASAKPWWSLEMIEQGAYALKSVLEAFNDSGGKSVKQDQQRAEELYRKILDKAFEWQREGVIRKKHLEDSATHMKGSFKKRAPAEWYNQIVLEFEDQMNKAARSQQFEKAIKWRDALIKLKSETDIYDVLHVVDELWSVRSIPEVKPFLNHNWDDFSDFAKRFLEQVNSEEGFEKWKKNGKL